MRDINLLNAHTRVQRQAAKKQWPVIAVTATVVVMMLNFYLWNEYRIRNINKEITELKSFINKGENVQKLKEFESTRQKNDTLTKYLAAVETLNSQLGSQDVLSSGLVERIAALMPPSLFVRTLSADTLSVQIQGIAVNRTVVAEFQHNLIKSGMFKDVQVDNISAEDEKSENLVFNLKCTLKGVK